jgi:hypothetical protein
MKNFLFIPLLVLATGFFFQACEKEQNLSDEALLEALATPATLQSVEPAQLPAPILETVETLFFDTYMENIYHGRGLGYRIELGNETCLYFRENGDMLEFRDPRPRIMDRFGPNGPHGPCFDRIIGFGRPIRPTMLPESVRQYVNTNYPDAVIRLARTNPNRYVVLISGPLVLVFDNQGNFLNEVNPLENCNPDRRCRGMVNAQLPAVASAYITENYPEATFRAACGRGERIAVFMVNNGERLILIFDANGNFLFSRP